MALLQVKQIEKSFGKKRLLKAVDFELKTGEILGVFGRNGSGKSTLLKILFGTQTAKTGSIKINESKYAVRKHFWNRNPVVADEVIGYLPQFSFLSQSSKVWDLIPKYFEGEEQDLIFRAPRMTKIAKRKVNELSLGERRYLEVLIVGNLKHPFLLLDEPFTGLDTGSGTALRQFLNLFRENGGTCILVTHCLDEADGLVDRLLVLERGHLRLDQALSGDLNQLYAYCAPYLDSAL